LINLVNCVYKASFSESDSLLLSEIPVLSASSSHNFF